MSGLYLLESTWRQLGLGTASGGLPPGQVTGVAAGAATSSSVVVSWQALVGAATYLVEYRTGSGAWSTFASGATGTTVTVTGLASATVYSFRVTAVNSAGPGPVSAAVAGTTGSTGGVNPLVPPTTPRAGRQIFYTFDFTRPIPTTDAASRYAGVLGSHTATCYLDPSHVVEDTANGQLVFVGSMDDAVWNSGKTSTRNGTVYTPQGKWITGGLSYGNLASRTPAFCSWETCLRMDKPVSGDFADCGYVFLEFYGPGTWPDCGEIDTCEGTQGSNQFATNIHYGKPAGVNFAVNGANKLGVDMTQWHRYRLDMWPGAAGQGATIISYVDDVEFNRMTNAPACFSNPNFRMITQFEAKSIGTPAQQAIKRQCNAYQKWYQLQTLA